MRYGNLLNKESHKPLGKWACSNKESRSTPKAVAPFAMDAATLSDSNVSSHHRNRYNNYVRGQQYVN